MIAEEVEVKDPLEVSDPNKMQASHSKPRVEYTFGQTATLKKAYVNL